MARAHLQAIPERAEKEKSKIKPQRRSRMDGLLQPTEIKNRGIITTPKGQEALSQPT